MCLGKFTENTRAANLDSSRSILNNGVLSRALVGSSAKAPGNFFPPASAKEGLYRWTVFFSPQGSSVLTAVCEAYRMRERFILVALFPAMFVAMASAALSQNAQAPSSRAPGPHPITRTEGRKILATISTIDADPESETDCSHFVHAV